MQFQHPESLLCVGAPRCGKSQFLQKYTHSKEDEDDYKIFIKKLSQKIIFLHQLSTESQVYLKYPYCGMLFFVDIFSYHKITENVLKWLELLSEHNGTNIFQIPIQVIAINSGIFIGVNYQTQKKRLREQLSDIIESDQQILFYEGEISEVLEDKLETYFQKIKEHQANGIKSSRSIIWRLYGISEVLRPISSSWTKLKLLMSGLMKRKSK